MSKATILLLVASMLALGCGVDEEPLRPRMGASSKSRLAAMSLEERIEATKGQDAAANEAFVRADGSEGDAEPDFRACRVEHLADPAYLHAGGVTRTLTLTRCMEAKGWRMNRRAQAGGAG